MIFSIAAHKQKNKTQEKDKYKRISFFNSQISKENFVTPLFYVNFALLDNGKSDRKHIQYTSKTNSCA